MCRRNINRRKIHNGRILKIERLFRHEKHCDGMSHSYMWLAARAASAAKKSGSQNSYEKVQNRNDCHGNQSSAVTFCQNKN